MRSYFKIKCILECIYIYIYIYIYICMHTHESHLSWSSVLEHQAMTLSEYEKSVWRSIFRAKSKSATCSQNATAQKSHAIHSFSGNEDQI